MFWAEIRKITYTPANPSFTIYKWGLRGSKLYRHVFVMSFPQYFQYISNFRSQITYSYVKCGCSINFFLNSANQICRGTETSRYFRESLGLRDNESRLYFADIVLLSLCVVGFICGVFLVIICFSSLLLLLPLLVLQESCASWLRNFLSIII